MSVLLDSRTLPVHFQAPQSYTPLTRPEEPATRMETLASLEIIQLPRRSALQSNPLLNSLADVFFVSLWAYTQRNLVYGSVSTGSSMPLRLRVTSRLRHIRWRTILSGILRGVLQ